MNFKESDDKEKNKPPPHGVNLIKRSSSVKKFLFSPVVQPAEVGRGLGRAMLAGSFWAEEKGASLKCYSLTCRQALSVV